MKMFGLGAQLAPAKISARILGRMRRRRQLSRLGLTLHSDLADLGDTLLAMRTMEAFDRGAARYPLHRLVRCAACKPLPELFDELAQHSGFAAQRLGEAFLLLDGPGVFVTARGRRKMDYSSCAFAVWAADARHLALARDRLLAIVGDQRIRDEMFTIDWYFASAQSGLTSATIEEMADPDPLDHAYPGLGEPVSRFIARYLNAPETVLILQGPPGTGKTRLVRAVLAAISRRKGDSATVLYTADKRALQSDEIFVEFATGGHDAFVIEDADHLLLSRTSGNDELHRFLTIADGIVRAQGRKILFTTNLPNVTDIDDALLRPGRCFAHAHVRSLERAEADCLLARLCGSDDERRQRALDAVLPADASSASLAAIYRAAEQVG